MKRRYRPPVGADVGVDSIAARFDRDLERERLDEVKYRDKTTVVTSL